MAKTESAAHGSGVAHPSTESLAPQFDRASSTLLRWRSVRSPRQALGGAAGKLASIASAHRGAWVLAAFSYAIIVYLILVL